MKIIFVVPDMAGGGTEHVISLLANEYVRRGIPTAILSFAGSRQAYPLDRRVETVSAGEASGGRFPVRVKRLMFMRRYFRKNKECYIFSFSTFGTGFIVLSTLGMRRRMLVSERTDPRSCDHKAYRNFFYHFADRLVCQTQEAVTCFPPSLQKKACVIANPIDASLPSRYTGERKKSVVTVGRLEPVKNQKMLIEAFADFAKGHGEYVLEIYGQGSLEEELKTAAKEAGIGDKVLFHGFCRDVKERILDSGMFVLCSNYEGLSNSLVEALAMGIPVIATDCPIGGCRTYVRDGENGLLIPVGDKAALTAAMTRLADEKELADQVSFHAEKVRQEFEVNRIATQLLNCMDR